MNLGVVGIIGVGAGFLIGFIALAIVYIADVGKGKPPSS